MNPYAELLEFNQPNPIKLPGFTRIRDQFPGLKSFHNWKGETSGLGQPGDEYYHDPERIIEFAGRWDYGPNSANKLGQPIIQRWLDAGEQSMIEMGHATFFIECSRVVSHELVRHRLASFQQESQRFVSYKDADIEDLFMIPDEVAGPSTDSLLEAIKYLYNGLQEIGVGKQLARYVLPNATRTRLIMSANIREWRHIIQLRLDKSAQPEMRELMQQIHDQLVMVFPQSLAGVLDSGRGVR